MNESSRADGSDELPSDGKGEVRLTSVSPNETKFSWTTIYSNDVGYFDASAYYLNSMNTIKEGVCTDYSL